MTSHAGALSSSLLQAWQERADPRAANASLSGFLRECAPESDSPVRIEHVRGRTGNHVHQLVNALIIAASAGRPLRPLQAAQRPLRPPTPAHCGGAARRCDGAVTCAKAPNAAG